MSHYAMGWAQRLKLGDPVAKAVLTHMCYVMRDENLLVYVGIPTLEEYTEYEERAIRAAIKRLLDRGVLIDTERKRNNVPIYRVAWYEEHLRRLAESPPENGGASPTDVAALAQVAELAKEKVVGNGAPTKHPPKGEGQKTSPPASAPKPPHVGGQALPLTGPNLPPDLPLPSGSADPGTDPTGPGAAPEKTPEGMDVLNCQSYWWNTARSYALQSAGLFGICGPRPEVFDEIPNEGPLYPRMTLIKACEDARDWAMGEHRRHFPLAKPKIDEITAGIHTRINAALEKAGAKIERRRAA